MVEIQHLPGAEIPYKGVQSWAVSAVQVVTRALWKEIDCTPEVIFENGLELPERDQPTLHADSSASDSHVGVSYGLDHERRRQTGRIEFGSFSGSLRRSFEHFPVRVRCRWHGSQRIGDSLAPCDEKMAPDSVCECTQGFVPCVSLCREIVLKRLGDPAAPLWDEHDIQVDAVRRFIGTRGHY